MQRFQGLQEFARIEGTRPAATQTTNCVKADAPWKGVGQHVIKVNTNTPRYIQRGS
jgi:hypothetical protein